METPTNLLPKTAILCGALSLICLFALHIVSPEFEPGWRMVSEYALGPHKYLVTLFFIFWGAGSTLMAVSLWKHATKIPARIGLVFLFISGIGAALASYYDVSQTEGHGFAGALGIPTVPIAALLVTYHLIKKDPWKHRKKTLLLLAHGTWIVLISMVVSMIVMISGFQNAGIDMGPDSAIPEAVPDGVIAVVGYVNRLLIVVDIFWVIACGSGLLKMRNNDTV